jgi:hypothetical protein
MISRSVSIHTPFRPLAYGARAVEVISHLSTVTALSMPMRDKVADLVGRYAGVLGDEFDYSLLLFDELNRSPVPRLIDQWLVGSPDAPFLGRSLQQAQAGLDFCGPLARQVLPGVLSTLRRPTSLLYSVDAEPAYFRDVHVPRVLTPNGWMDCLACAWFGSDRHGIVFSVLRRITSRAFVDADRQTLELMTRSLGPLVDASMFEDVPLPSLRSLSREQSTVLFAMLLGLSDAEIALKLRMMRDEVDILISSTLKSMRAESRGELLAMCVDERIVNWLDGSR